MLHRAVYGETAGNTILLTPPGCDVQPLLTSTLIALDQPWQSLALAGRGHQAKENRAHKEQCLTPDLLTLGYNALHAPHQGA